MELVAPTAATRRGAWMHVGASYDADTGKFIEIKGGKRGLECKHWESMGCNHLAAELVEQRTSYEYKHAWPASGQSPIKQFAKIWIVFT